MKIDYKKELESASRGMIMIHDPKTLIKLIVRMIVRKLGVKHAAMVLYDPQRKAYVLSISRGETGVKIPQGFARFDNDSPIVKLFRKKEFSPLRVNKNAIVSDDLNRMIWMEHVIENGNGNGTKELLQKVDEQMELLNVDVCVPAYYQKRLMAIMLLGEKHDGTKFAQEELDFFAALASDTAMAIRNAQLFDGLRREAERNKELFIKTLIVLGHSIEAKDAYTQGHSEQVTEYALEIGRQMVRNGDLRFSKVFFENLYIACLLHDIGKIGIPESILQKKGRLTKEEYETMQQHPVQGVEIVKPLSLDKDCIDAIRCHHENYNGKGYPQGLKGAAVPIMAYILAVADAFDAMYSDRPYRKRMEKEEAIDELKNNSGTQFHPHVVRAIVDLHLEGKI